MQINRILIYAKEQKCTSCEKELELREEGRVIDHYLYCIPCAEIYEANSSRSTC